MTNSQGLDFNPVASNPDTGRADLSVIARSAALASCNLENSSGGIQPDSCLSAPFLRRRKHDSPPRPVRPLYLAAKVILGVKHEGGPLPQDTR